MAHEAHCWNCGEALSAPYENALVIDFAAHVEERHGESPDLDDVRRWVGRHGSRTDAPDPSLLGARVIAGGVAVLFVLIGLSTGGVAWFGIAALAVVLVLMTSALEAR